MKVTPAIYLFYNLCSFALEPSNILLIMIFLSSFKVTSTIYLFYHLCRFILELSTNILTMIFLSSFKVTSTIYLFYHLCRFTLVVLACTEYKPINSNPPFLKVIFTFYLTISTFLYQVFLVLIHLQ